MCLQKFMAEEPQIEKKTIRKTKKGKARSKQFGKVEIPTRGVYWCFKNK